MTLQASGLQPAPHFLRERLRYGVAVSEVRGGVQRIIFRNGGDRLRRGW